MPLDITRSDHSIEELWREACRCENSKQARRLLGLAMALEGVSREVAGKAAGVGTGALPTGVKALPPSSTPWAFVLVRTYIKDASDLAAAFAIQDKYKLTPLSQ